MSRDPYRVLGVAPDADPADIRRAYQKLARRFHPALNAGDAEATSAFREVTAAYELLRDEEARRRYDSGEASGREVRRVRHRRATLGAPDLSWRVEELVVELDRGIEPRSGAAAPSPDIVTRVTLDLREAVRGVTSSVAVQRERPCASCGGSGAGCGDCEGRGVVVGLERARVRIPAGVDDGDRLRIPGQGNRVPEGRGRGDLILEIRVRPHPTVRRVGPDLYSEVPISVREAVVGGDIQIPTLDGRVRLRVPPKTPGGRRFRLRGFGVARGDGSRGDHFCTVRLVLPEMPARELEEWARALPEHDPRRELPERLLDE